MAYYTSSDGAGLEEGKSVQLRASRGNSFISAKVSDANSDLVMVQGRYGKRYGIWMTETSKGSFIGEKMFPRTLRFVWLSLQMVSCMYGLSRHLVGLPLLVGFLLVVRLLGNTVVILMVQVVIII